MLAASKELGSGLWTVFTHAVNANPLISTQAPARASSTGAGGGHGLGTSGTFSTGTRVELEQVGADYGVTVEVTGSGSMVTHTEPFFVIGADGRIRSTWDSVTGPGRRHAARGLGDRAHRRPGPGRPCGAGEGPVRAGRGRRPAGGLLASSTTDAAPVLDGGTAQGSTAMAVLAMGDTSKTSNQKLWPRRVAKGFNGHDK